MQNPYGTMGNPPQSNLNGGIYPQNNYSPANTNFGLKSGIQYATEEEMKALILPPNTQVMAMGKEGDVFYVKTADELGRSTMSVFDYKKHEENVSRETIQYITKDDLKDFATKEELNNVLSQCKDIEKLLKVGKKNGEESVRSGERTSG
jgi:hypothetical protein